MPKSQKKQRPSSPVSHGGKTPDCKEIERYKRALGIALDALTAYADPASYHAVAFLFDRPCGEFADDFSRVRESGYNRPMPGKLARQAFRNLGKRYPNLPYISYLHDEDDGDGHNALTEG